MTNIVQLLSEVSKAVGAVKKDQKNTAQKFNFRGIDQVVNATHEAFTERGIIVTPRVVEKDTREITSGGGKRQAWVLLTVEYAFRSTDGAVLTCEVASEATDFADKATAKAMSVAYRTALLQVLHLPTDDPDPDSEYEERGASLVEVARGQVIDLLRAKEIAPDAAAALFTEFGGKGKISECGDAELLERFRAHVAGL
ncbi:ERF family protein [Rhodococcus sp. NPDC019627]|uniref:ERF family protein n=1 Tax=unclassified Rhodococcus (in: high G+C Gram-positive bacteria) TaxID=192944 RepID=UPI0033F3F429